MRVMRIKPLAAGVLLAAFLGLTGLLTGCDDSSAASGEETSARTATAAPQVGNSSAMADTPDLPPKPEYVVNVKVETVVPVRMQDMLILPGETEALDDIKLAAERAGVVEWVGVTEGQMVKEGQQVVRINLSALQAALDRARANLKLAEEQLRRRRDLYARKVLSREELEQAENEQTVAQANLREAEVNLNYGITSSPVSGVVNKVYVDPGEYVGEGATVADIVNVSTLRVNFNVPEADVRFLAEGQKAEVRVDTYPGKAWIGTIDFVAWKADTATRTFQVRLVVDNREGKIRPGMIARASFVRRALADAVTAPLFCVQDKGGERIVFVEKDGVAQARTVELGVIEDDRVQVLKGLVPGDRLIIVGHTEVEDGTKVNVR
ncbi:efflux RND transporter periplasmic adaptor subunit [Desulfovibrio mangrovi]|uniref:efflux RND transporter periplasmic adaptor subunit n=1 Tax=Desulfovibrio mangrovi TaxID=2976983 RepID=UPI0022479BAE|nr:efflux RND transporter periplasmic adaptor subunit [Desulfovibrio mangrovi]UZP66028.1 efflux RND transporter periplasmic adaptor subunit [Desulfovibrio mangrovi]